MKHSWIAALFLLFSLAANATDYTFNSASFSNAPPCVGGSWSRSGSVITCSGQVVLSAGDTIQVSSWVLGSITLYATNGFVLNSNVIGNSSKTITLQSGYGAVTASGTNTVYGDIITSSGAVSLSNTTLNGSITTSSTVTMSGGSVSGNITASNGVNLTNTSVTGTITASSGSITLTGGEVGGLVRSNCCTITTDGTDLYGGARSDSSGISISNGTIAGDFYAANNYAEFNNVVMTSGTISGASSLVVNNSTLGTASTPVTVSTQSGAITLNNTTAYGDFTTPSWTTVIATGTTTIIGTCTPGSTPASACQTSSATLTCLTDTFSSSTLGDDWVSSVFSGSFTPSVSSGRLLLTQDTTYQSTATTLQRWFPAEDNIVVIEFDHYAWSSKNGDGADGITVVFSDATVTPQAGSFGGSLGYAQRNNGDSGFAGGWIGIALDEYGNFSNPTEGRIGGSGFVTNSVAVRGSGSDQSGYRFITGTSSLNPNIDVRNTTSARPGYRYRITIDARTGTAAYVSVERSTNGGSSYSTLISSTNVAAATDQATIPENLWLSLTGSTGASSNAHAIDNLQVCAKTINPVGDLVHHFEMVYASNALTCSPQEVLIRACKNAACSELYTDDVSVTLSPSGWEGGDTLTISGGSSTFNLWHTTAETVSLTVTSSTPVRRAYTTNTCSVDGGTLSSSCSLTFADSGFVLDVDTFTASQGDSGASIKAVKKDDSSETCVPAFASVSRNVDFWSTYVNPDNTSRVVSWPLTVNGSAIGGSEAAATSVSLAFDANGSAPLTVNYADAGRMQLNALLAGSGNDAGLSMSGNTQFNSVPLGFCVKTGGECAAANASCPAFVAAGDAFTASIQAVGWQAAGDTDLCTGNTPTPSFVMSSMSLSADKVSPSGGVNGVVTPASYNHSAGSDNLNSVSVSESEVGVFRLRVSPSSTYLGSTISDGLSAATGRFYPHHFAVSATNSGEISAYCDAADAFAYTGQPLSWLTAPRIQIQALNLAGSVTQNYTQTGYQKLTSATVLSALQFPAADNSALGSDSNLLTFSVTPQTGALSVAAAGVLNYDFSALDSMAYSKTLYARVAPFNPDLTFSLAGLTDGDASQQTSVSFSPQANFGMRYGRLWIESGYGPETDDLALNMRTEVYDGSRFNVNSDDSCWTYDSVANVVLGTSGLTEVSGNSGTLSSGVASGGIVLTAPVNVSGTPDTGETSVEYAVPLWLYDDFDDDGALEPHSGTATFGVYRGNDHIIYWREIYR